MLSSSDSTSSPTSVLTSPMGVSSSASASVSVSAPRPTVRTLSVPPPLPLGLGNDSHVPVPLSPISPKSPLPPPPAPPTAPQTPSSLSPPTPIPSYMQATKAFVSRSAAPSPSILPLQPPLTPTRTGSLASSIMSPSSSASGPGRKPTRSSTSRSRSRPRAAAHPASTTFTPSPDTPPLPCPSSSSSSSSSSSFLPALAASPPVDSTTTTTPPPPPSSFSSTGDLFPCASCRAHYTTTSGTPGSSFASRPFTALPPSAAHPNKLYRHLLDLQISNDTLAVLNADLQSTVTQQAKLIHQLEDHLARITDKVRGATDQDELALLLRHAPDDDDQGEEEEIGMAGCQASRGWYEPVSEDKIQDHAMLLARMCDRTHRMLFDARRAVNRTRGDMESVSVDEDQSVLSSDRDDDLSIDFSPSPDEEPIEIEAGVVPKIVMQPPLLAPSRGRQMSTSCSIASSATGSLAGGGQFHSLVKSLAYHIHLLDSTPPAPDAHLLSPTRRTSSSTVSSSRTPAAAAAARSPSPLSLTRTPSGLGVLGLGAVLDLVPPASHTPHSSAAAAAAARKHQVEQCMVVQRCKDTVLQLCAEAGVPMGDVHEMVVDAQMHVATAAPASPTALTSASRLANPAVASRHPGSSWQASASASGTASADEDLVDIRSDASSTRSNYSRVSSSRSSFFSHASDPRGAASSVLGPNASASALGRAAGAGMVYPAGLTLEEKYRMHLEYQQAQGSNARGPGGSGFVRVIGGAGADDNESGLLSPTRPTAAGGGSTVSGSGNASLVSSPPLLPDSASAVSGGSGSGAGARGVRVKAYLDSGSVVSSGGSSNPATTPAGSVAAGGGGGGGTPSRVASVLSGLMSTASSSRVNGGDSANGSPQGSSTGRSRGGPGAMVARAIKVRTWMG